ncbi:MAG: AAA family ATPase [Pseudomonadota bacterium]
MVALIALSGLPGVGKTTLARCVAARANAIHLRVDSVEAALKRSTLAIKQAEDAGYLALAAIAADNLRLGFNVIADTVNPVKEMRELWAQIAADSAANILNVEVICTDQALQRERVETRKNDVKGLVLPSWQAVTQRVFEPWREDRMVIDTSAMSASECAETIVQAMTRLSVTTP